MRFLDTNILLRYFTRDDEAKARKALVLLQRVEKGEEKVETSLPVIFETIFTLKKQYKMPIPRIKELLLPILRMRGLRLPAKTLCIAALNLFAERNISYADAFNAVYMQSKGITEVYSWDTDFDRIKGITRIEPAGVISSEQSPT
jgi:predicted nucleic acid-binding protein